MTIYKLKNKQEYPIKGYDNKGNLIHQKDSNGYEYWYDYDNKGNEIHYKNSEGYGYWKGEKGNKITEEEFNKIWEKVE